MTKNTEHGGIFFYILLAILLLAGLAYVISQNNRGNTNILTDEQARVAAQEIIDYGNTVATTIQKLILRGCKVDGGLSFYHPNASRATNYDISTAPTDESCHIFSTNGGNMNWGTPPQNGAPEALEYQYIGRFQIYGVGTDQSPTTDKDQELMMAVPVNINTCLEINKKYGMNFTTNTIPSYTFTVVSNHPLQIPNSTWHMYGESNVANGGFIDNMTIGGTVMPEFAHKPNFCFHQLDGNPSWPYHDTYWYLHTLVAR